MLETEEAIPNHCKNCGKAIQIAIFKGEDWCSENCRKVLGEDVN